MLYRPDGVHLSDMGLDIFLDDLQGGIRVKIFSLVGAWDIYSSPIAVAGSAKVIGSSEFKRWHLGGAEQPSSQVEISRS